MKNTIDQQHENRQKTKGFLASCSGATVIEYALIVSMIFLVIMLVIHSISDTTGTRYDNIRNAVSSSTG